MRRLVLLLTIPLLLTACSGDDPAAAPSSPDTPTPVATSSPTPDAPSDTPSATPDTSTPAPTATETPTAAPTPFDANTEDDTAEGRGDLVTVRDLRTGGHDAFDRVVFDLAGDGMAGWRVGYVDDPAQQGSGDPVTVAGGAVLEVDLTHTGYPDDTGGEAYDGPRRIPGTGVVAELYYSGIFEGHTQVFVGVDERLPFRVYEADGKVILDVGHEPA